MRKLTALGLMALLVAACDVETDSGTADGEGAATGAAATAEGGADATAAGGALPPDDGDLRVVDVTLTEWNVALAHDSVPAGAIAFNVRNSGSVVHRFEVEGNGEEWASEDISAGDDIVMSLNLSPGVYEVYCPVVTDGENHEALGMTTTLHVY